VWVCGYVSSIHRPQTHKRTYKRGGMTALNLPLGALMQDPSIPL